ncbi:hypothetical protein VV02_12850 [Luteipulveratus mongoliensis]|uniref:DUF4232 domain-containing protein n=2 Tax=Luteipulveratus mongoliensis TaxID=571913 RepID=A0A0K1JIK9_9MICO|nr:hypothetical protein VV02_12850 [Luteipulveratus mongoliensis]
MGYREMVITATNVGPVRCTLTGHATLALADENGGAIKGQQLPRVPMMDDKLVAAERHRLAPGKSAQVYLAWRGESAIAGLPQVKSLRMIATKGSALAPVTLTAHSLPIDIVQGSTFAISGWRAVPERH